MRVSYNGFTGELVKMKRKKHKDTTWVVPTHNFSELHVKEYRYDISIYDSEKSHALL